MQHYKEFIDFLIKYEELNVKKSTPEDPFRAKFLSGDNKVDIKEQLT